MPRQGRPPKITITPLKARKLLEGGMTVRELAAQCYVSRQYMSHWLQKNDITAKPGASVIRRTDPNRPNLTGMVTEGAAVSHDVEQARLVDRLLDLCRTLGMEKMQIATIRNRILPSKIREASRDDREVIERLRQARDRALDYLDDVTLASAPAKDLANIVAVLTDRIQLLSGQPTQIMRVEDRRTLNELGEALFNELNRRGIKTIDVPSEEIIDG